MKVKISNKLIGENNPVFIVAEAGINHNGSTRIAKKLIKKAKECGADAIKFQTFKATDLTSNKSKFFKLFKKLELKSHEFAELSFPWRICKEHEIELQKLEPLARDVRINQLTKKDAQTGTLEYQEHENLVNQEAIRLGFEKEIKV